VCFIFVALFWSLCDFVKFDLMASITDSNKDKLDIQ